MKKNILVVLCLVFVCAAAVNAGGRSDDPIGVAVSPQTLLLGSSQGGHVAVHTDGLPYTLVIGSSVTLNGIKARSVGSDLCGDLVAHFDEGEIKAIVTPPSVVMTLEGLKTDGTAFSGSDTVQVIQK